MRAPSPEQKAKEAAIFYTILADMLIGILLLVFALITRSLTLLSEGVRLLLMLLVEFYSFVVLRAVHRNRLGKFRFGIGKLEQFCNLAIGAALVASGFWVAGRVFALLLLEQAAASPLGLATAAVINAINTMINILGWYAMKSAARGDDSPIYKAQLRARMVKLVSSLFVQTTLTIAALAKDPTVSIWLDAIGAAFVACIMISIGLKMLGECVPDLLDHAVPEEMKARIHAVLVATGIAPEEVVRLRTRRSGSLAQVELTLTAADSVLLSDFEQRARRVQRVFDSHIQDADVTIVIHGEPT